MTERKSNKFGIKQVASNFSDEAAMFSQPPEPQSRSKKPTKKRIFFLISIVLFIAVLIAAVAWFSIPLIQNKNTGNSNNNSNNNDDDSNYNYNDNSNYNNYSNNGSNNGSKNSSNNNNNPINEVVNLGNISCPQPGNTITIDLVDKVAPSKKDIQNHHSMRFKNSPQGILCTLLEVSTDAKSTADRELELKPIGRSYNGGGWEPYHGLYASTNAVPLSCTDNNNSADCEIILPPLPADRKYILKSHEYSLGPRDEASRFLERTTFGATNSEIDALVSLKGDEDSNDNNPFTNWIQDQLKLPTTSHRSFFRERANYFHAETTWMGTLGAGPCQAGALYRKFVFVRKDKGRMLTIVTSPIDDRYKILLVGGKFRSLVYGNVEHRNLKLNTQLIPDGSYEICKTGLKSFIGSPIQIMIGNNCNDVIFDGVSGNPTVKIDEQHLGLAERLVSIDAENNAIEATEVVFANGPHLFQLDSDASDQSCTQDDTPTIGAPEEIIIASIGSEFWIYSPFFQLKSNTMRNPLPDGGKSSVEETANAPEDRMRAHCSNAPRTFLNEEYCILSDNACSNSGDVQLDSESGGAKIVCGSPYEFASKVPSPGAEHLGRGSFDMMTHFNKTLPADSLSAQKETVWLEIALNGDDQLRQKLAWALSQILVVSPDAIKLHKQSESFLTYYDIFVRNAFGNYFDILKEVTYSPLMGEMLTYKDGISTGRVWAMKNRLQYADENYARELLQLFSIGLYKLNDDGTIQTSADGHEIRTYKNYDISEYAKVFLGFKKQTQRGNVEDSSLPNSDRNDIDPMRIVAEYKDHFPKLGMDNMYVGDGYPLCKDLPARNFLQKGAIFRLLGSNPNGELVNDPEEWFGDPVRLSLEKPSMLSSILCNKVDGGRCAPKMKVVLDSDIECYGVECTVEELRAFEVWKGSDVWYEYIRPPCVNHAFYDGARSVQRRWGKSFGTEICGDPENVAASTVCCDDASNERNSQKKEFFSGERVSFEFAQNRCSSSATTQTLCEKPLVTDNDCRDNGGCDNLGLFYWSSSQCSLMAKINQEGKVAVLHQPQIENNVNKMVTEDTQTYFRVHWPLSDTGSIVSDLIGDCVRFGCTNGDKNTCICPTSIRESKAFVNDEDLISVENVLSLATIGSFHQAEDEFQPIKGVNGLSKYPRNGMTSKTIFRVVDSNGQIHFRKNTRNEVRLGTGQAKFRNPVTFYSLTEPTIRDASYETDAALNHAFFHKNTAPFLAVRLAQRFGNSNPSPRFVRSISRAFRTGEYIHPSTGKRFGINRYGCLKATITAILLDKEMLDPILDVDPTHGSVHEPYLKIVKVLRSLEFKHKELYPLLTIKADLQGLIGQQSHELPNVFSFFKSEFQPEGRIHSAGMTSPESRVLSGPTSIQMTNTIISYLKYGVSTCYGGFGTIRPKTCSIGAAVPNEGGASYDPNDNGLVTATDIVSDLATLLTSGRLDEAKREVIKKAYEDTIGRGKSSSDAVINAQQLVVASPEFHTTNLGNIIGQARALPALPESTNIPYKAVVFVLLPGGYDSYNVLVPKSCSVKNSNGKAIHDQYLEERGIVAFSEREGEFALSINATDSNQPCSEFAVHDELKIVKELFDTKDLTFFANAGIINNQGMTKQNYHELTRSQLFAHNAMQHEIAKVDPYDKVAGTGIMGRAKDVLSKLGHVVNTISIDNPSIAVNGNPGESSPATIVGRKGSQKFASRPEREYDFDIEKHARTLNGKVDEFSGIFGDTWAQQFSTGLDEAEEYQSIFDQAELDESIWMKKNAQNDDEQIKTETEHWDKWSTIAKLIQERDFRNVDRDFFFTEVGSWDHHDDMKVNLRSQLSALNYGLEMFVKQAKISGFWDDVTVVIASDFGRTFTANSNEGTDHGWGGHYMVLGGDVKGGRILGKYPSDLTPASDLVDDRGRFLPTTSWDSIWNGILEWTGVTEDADLDYCLPNRLKTTNPVADAAKGFPLLTKQKIFRNQESSKNRKLRGGKE